MKGTTEGMKGRIKEAAGAVSGNDELRARGQMDQAAGHAKRTVEGGARHGKGSARKTTDKALDNVNEDVE